jgi:predicted adenylyl cyclase CyaB
MPRNIEIKARVKNFEALQQQVEAISDTPVEVIPQTDTFFHAPQGRLKLRELTTRGELIYYERQNVSGPKQSNYMLSRTDDPQSLEALLAAALGVRGVVKKIRYLYMVGNTRIHLDRVEGLGNFLEFEVVLGDDDTPAEGERIAADLMQTLGLDEADLIEGAYMDLLEPPVQED